MQRPLDELVPLERGLESAMCPQRLCDRDGGRVERPREQASARHEVAEVGVGGQPAGRRRRRDRRQDQSVDRDRGVRHHIVTEAGIARIRHFQVERIADPAEENEAGRPAPGLIGDAPVRSARLLEFAAVHAAPGEADHRFGRPCEQSAQLGRVVPGRRALRILVVVFTLLAVEYAAVVGLAVGVEVPGVDQPEIIFIDVRRMLAAAFPAARIAAFLVLLAVMVRLVVVLARVPRLERRRGRRIARRRDADEAGAEPDRALDPEWQLQRPNGSGRPTRRGGRRSVGRTSRGRFRHHRDPGWPGVALGGCQQVQPFPWRGEQLHLGRIAPLQQAERGMRRRQMVGPIVDPARDGDRQGRALQLLIEQGERLDLGGLFQFHPFDPVLLVEFAALAGLPDPEADEPAVPEAARRPR